MLLQRTTAILAAGLLFGLGAAAAPADEPTTTSMTTTTTESTTATAPTTTSTTPTTTTTTAVQTTTAWAAPPSTTTTTPTTTETAPVPVSATPSTPLARGCGVIAVAILQPHHGPVALGPVAAGGDAARFRGLRYPANGSIVTASAVTLHDRACSGRERIHAGARIESLSVFGDAVTASGVTLALGAQNAATVSGLVVDGKRIDAAHGGRVPLQHWGYLVVAAKTPLHLPSGGVATSALAVHLLQAHSGLAAGTVILVAVAARAGGRATLAVATQRSGATHEALKVTPPLGVRHYVFPVVGPSEYVDTYGAFRSDIRGKWHHGDDIFAPLGAPVVAVADGTINRVGWEQLGGWRLWVRDSVGDEFYYAHLSGYAPGDLRSNRVRAGEVIGFIGNTGDAFTTSPHLHFEVHPRPLLHLGYDGAVDPTRYLDGWTRLRTVRAPRPTHPALPTQPLVRQEARYVFRELLAARHLIRRAPTMRRRPHVDIPRAAVGTPLLPPAIAARATAPSRRGPHPRSAHWTAAAGLAVGLGALALAATMLLGHRWRRREGGNPPSMGPAPGLD